MKATITSLELKSPWQFFALSSNALKILKQLKSTNHLDFKKRGFWTTHYTMTLWESAEDLRRFATSGAHLEAMKKSNKIAREIRTITIDADKLPSWKEAKALLNQAKVFNLLKSLESPRKRVGYLGHQLRKEEVHKLHCLVDATVCPWKENNCKCDL